MKEYFNANLPVTTIKFIGILLVSVIFQLSGNWSQYFMLYPHNLVEPANYYRLLTSHLYISGLFSWLSISLFLFLSGTIIEKYLSEKETIRLILISAIAFSFIYLGLNYRSHIIFSSPYGGPGIIMWAYWAAAIVLGFEKWKSHNLFEKIIVIICCLGVINFRFENLGLLVGQIVIILSVGTWSFRKIRRDSQKSEIESAEIV